MEINKLKSGDLFWLKENGINYYLSDKNNLNLDTSIEIKNNKIELNDKYDEKNLNKDIDMRKPKINLEDNEVVILARKIADDVKTIEELKEQILAFEGCKLKHFANNTVFADGNSNAKIMFIGEAPGSNEDKYGIPFCGESGQLLDNMLACIGISRANNAYITNTVFWRPPANRAPTQEEIDICRPFVEKHIALIKPELIVLVGNTAATSLLGHHEGITKIRKNNYAYSNKYITEPIQTTAMFHPAYLLRQPLQKKAVWFDLIKIQQFVKEFINLG